MKVVAINGSPRLIGNTANAVGDLFDELEKEGIETEHVQIYADHLSPCNDCRSCEMRGDGRCIIEDDRLNEIVDMMAEADGIVLASPTYYGSCTGQMKIFLERAGLATETGGLRLRRKVGAALVVQAHEGGSMVYSELVNFMLRNQMVVCGSTPCTILTAKDTPGYLKDEAGMRALRTLGREMSWLLGSLSR
ncbi:MAG: flavodoxin family protein [Candidatus Methanomethylophilaceae archaeon]|jgi:multimeric flavodoxin WrbA|nr:flavodoxin family protein [Candidatus Methanomethylophilaceae archaeon]NLF33674.1 flavodoxin family protein [Thermoplasmatales archaeon]